MTGLLRFVAPGEKPRVTRWIGSPAGRTKLLRVMQHNLEMDPRFCTEPEKGERSHDGLLRTLRRHGAPRECYVISSDGQLDNSFQPLETIVLEMLGNFTHGTFISCIPGKLALFRTAWPFRHLICLRSD